MIERLSQILVENTVSVEVKCVLNESVIDNNFRVIIDCLRDLENKQSSMQNLIEEINQRNAAMQKEIEGARIGTGAGIFSEENIRGGDGEDRVSISSRKEERGKEEREGREEREKGVENHSVQKMENEGEMRELIRQIQDQLSKQSEENKKNNLENIKDINIILKDIKELKSKVEALENINKDNLLKQQETQPSTNAQPEFTQENIRTLQNELHRQSDKLDKLQSDVDKVKNKNSQVMEKLKAIGEGGAGGVGIVPANLEEDPSESQVNQLKGELERLAEKVKSNEERQREDARELTKRWENADISLKQQDERNKANELSIDDILNRLDSLNTNVDSSADKEKSKLEKELRRLEDANRKDSSRNDEWRRRVDENIKEHTLQISELQGQVFNMDNTLNNLQKDKLSSSSKDLNEGQRLGGERLPSISGKKGLRLKNSREESSQKNTIDIDNKLQELKSDLQNWVRQLLDTRNIGGVDHGSKKKDEVLDGIDLRIQEIKLILERKADQEGVKKYLSFLDNKINQIWAILSQPQTEDALIARKGWNCLSCAKKLQKYRGRIGQHLNWNGLTTTGYSPPKINQTVSYNNTAQNFNPPVPKARQFSNQQDSKSKEFP